MMLFMIFHKISFITMIFKKSLYYFFLYNGYNIPYSIKIKIYFIIIIISSFGITHYIKKVLLHLLLKSVKNNPIKKIATVGIEPTTLALLAPRSNQTELYGLLLFFIQNVIIFKNITKK